MKKVIYLLTLLFCCNLFSQRNTCQSTQYIIEDLSNIDKCTVASLKKEKTKDPIRRSFNKRTRFLRKRSKNASVSLSSNIKVNKVKNTAISDLAAEDWKNIKLIAKTISENSISEKDFVNFNSVEQIPLFYSCEELSENQKYSCFNKEMSKHIKRHFKYPKKALKSYVQGSIVIEFTINKKGEIRNIQTTGHKNVKLLKKEAIRVVEKLPNFIPGSHNGETVNVKYVMPINFKY